VNLGQGGAAVHMLDVNCTGTESNLLECVDSGSGMTPLSMVDGDCSMPAGVICEGKCLLSMMYIIDYCGYSHFEHLQHQRNAFTWYTACTS